MKDQTLTVTKSELERILRGIQSAQLRHAVDTGETVRLTDLLSRARNKMRNYRLQLKQLTRAHVIQKRELEILRRHYSDQIVNYSMLHAELERVRATLRQAVSNQDALIAMQQFESLPKFEDPKPVEFTEIEFVDGVAVPAGTKSNGHIG